MKTLDITHPGLAFDIVKTSKKIRKTEGEKTTEKDLGSSCIIQISIDIPERNDQWYRAYEALSDLAVIYPNLWDTWNEGEQTSLLFDKIGLFWNTPVTINMSSPVYITGFGENEIPGVIKKIEKTLERHRD